MPKFLPSLEAEVAAMIEQTRAMTKAAREVAEANEREISELIPIVSDEDREELNALRAENARILRELNEFAAKTTTLH